MADIATATIEMEGDSQMVRLPDGFRLPGHEVRVMRSGDGLLLEPIKPPLSPEEIKAILDQLKRWAAEDGPFMPEGREQPQMPCDDEPNPFDAGDRAFRTRVRSGEKRSARSRRAASQGLARAADHAIAIRGSRRGAADIRADLKRRGKPIGPYDTLIAAQARCRGATLVTANTREFVRVVGLTLEDWTI